MTDEHRFETGREAYEDDLAASPVYFDGKPRPAWDALDKIAQQSWNRNPTRRRPYHERLGKNGAAKMRAAGLLAY